MIQPNWTKNRSLKLIRKKISLVDIILMNAAIASFTLFLFEQFVSSREMSLVRWVVIFVWITFLFLRLLFSGRILSPRMPISGRISAVMILWFFFTIILNSTDVLKSLEKLGAILMFYILGYILLRKLYATSHLKEIFIISLSTQMIVFLIYGYGISLLKNINLLGLERQFGLYYRPGVPALMASSLIILATSVIFTNAIKSIAMKIFLSIIGILSVLFIYATGVRSVLLSTILVISIWLFFVFKKHRVLLIMSVMLLLLFQINLLIDWYKTQEVFVRPEKFGFLSGRIDRYKDQVRQFLDSPFAGTGFASKSSSNPEMQSRALSHNAYLGAFAETGIFGGLLFIAWIVYCVYEAYRSAHRYRGEWSAQYGFMLVSMLTLVSLVEALLFSAGNVFILAFYVIVGLIGSEARPYNRMTRPFRSGVLYTKRRILGNITVRENEDLE